ncbi:TetR/AcrR family transcriptional regulator [Nocardia yunnanensis]|uniref:TetR/AcrR family transcriptional regulator n=1 Tax=Nocardia yunnanensis TaxID=2382165 RepID=A0A386ZDB2_9NOCA|nr:TetR/AcrR family transcriptional regulator [Nocardia yunnanensis]AYF75478.1 TetR/AcrR family transcriptional regulator [Nocardia yunnanensis]
MTERKAGKSGPGRPAGSDSIDTRQRVLDAAIRCFAQSGYGPATNSAIAEIAGVTAGSVFYHFGTKSKLFEAVCAEVYGRIIERSSVAISGALSVRELLRAVLSVSARLNHEHPELAGFVVTAPIDARRHKELSEGFAAVSTRMIEGLTEAVGRGQEAGQIPDDLDPVLVARLILAVVDGFAHAAAATDPVALDTLDALFERLLLDAASEPGEASAKPRAGAARKSRRDSSQPLAG